MENVPKDVAAFASAIPMRARLRTSPEEDRALVRRAQAGAGEAYEELVRRHQQRVFGVISGILRRREDVEDVAQQVFMKAYVSLRRFDLRSAFSTWLHKIAVNECWDYLRKKKVRPLLYEADLSEEQAEKLDGLARADAPLDPGQHAVLRDLVDFLLQQLPEEDRQMLVLKEVEGFSVEEVGSILNLNVNTVKVRLFRARGRLLKMYRRKLADKARPAATEREAR
jgi:RNA polymerase sigma-70 factor (ECF subfamily)